jgi:hypothetical protein
MTGKVGKTTIFINCVVEANCHFFMKEEGKRKKEEGRLQP